MRVIQRKIEYEGPDNVVRVVPIFDVHLGNAACDEKLLGEVVEEVRSDPRCYWIGGGDYCDFIARDDRRYRETGVASWLHGVNDTSAAQVERFAEMLGPIEDRCLGLLRGNHEDDILNKYERDVYALLVDKLRPSPISGKSAPIMLGYQGFIHLYFERVGGSKDKRWRSGSGSWSVVVYCHHGYGGGRMEGGHALALGRVFKNFDCDVALMGHRHVRTAVTQIQLGISRRGANLIERYQVAAFCGSFLRGHSEDEVYSEAKGLPPLPLGPIRLEFTPAERKVRVLL